MAANTTLATLRADLAVRLARLPPRARDSPRGSSASSGSRPPSLETPVGNLSGGNQQKVALARWLAAEPGGADPRRADAGRRRRRQGRDPPAHERAGRARAGHPDDLVRAARDPRHERPDRRDARRHDRRRRWTAPARPRRRSWSWRWATSRRERECVLMIGRYRRELSVAAAYAALLLRPGGRGPAASSRPIQLRALRGEQRPGAGGRGRDDAGDPLPPDRHLDRLDLQHLRRGRRAAGPGRAADRRWSAWGRSLAGGGMGAINGVAGRRAGLAVDRGDAGHAGDRPRVAPLRARGRVRPQPAAGLPVVRRWARRPGQWLVVAIALVVFAAFAWGLRNLAAGRAVYATGSDPEAARLAGIRPAARRLRRLRRRWARWPGWPRCSNAVRFADVDPNAGDGPGAPGHRRRRGRRRGRLRRPRHAGRHA